MAVQLKKYITKRNKDVPYLYIDQNGFFWARKRIGALTPKIALETDVESVAISKVHSAILQLEKKVEQKSKKSKGEESFDLVLFSDFFEYILKKKEVDGIRESTLVRIRIIRDKSLKPSLFWNLKPSEITKADGVKFKNWHKSKRINERTGKPVQLVNVMKYLGETLRTMVEMGVLEQKNMPDIDLPLDEIRHHKAYKGRTIKPSEFLVIYENFDERYRLLPGLAHDLGNRKMELGSLKSSSVIRKGQKVYIDLSHDDTKTGIPRIIPVPDRYAEELWKRKMANKYYIFESVRDPKKHITSQVIDKLWGEAKRKSKVKGRLRFHDLRDCAATNMVKAKMNLVIVCTILGMSMKTLQQKYLQLTPEDLLNEMDSMVKYLQEAA